MIPNTGTVECQSGVLEVLPCDLGPCPRPCAWSTWTSWSECGAAPGQLDCTQARTREVARQEVGAGRACEGEDREARYCVSLTCQGKTLNIFLPHCHRLYLQDTLVSQDHQVKTDLRVTLELRELLESRANREGPAVMVSTVSMGREHRMDFQDPRDLPATPVLTAVMGWKVSLVRWDLRDLWDLMVRKVSRACLV